MQVRKEVVEGAFVGNRTGYTLPSTDHSYDITAPDTPCPVQTTITKCIHLHNIGGCGLGFRLQGSLV